MGSMTDIVFLLLIFFLVTSTLVNPNALKLLLPKSTGQVSAKPTVSVSIKDWGGEQYTYHINGNEIAEDIAQVLESLGAPTKAEQVGVDPAYIADGILFAKELRDRYTILQLLWDIDRLEEMKEVLMQYE